MKTTKKVFGVVAALLIGGFVLLIGLKEFRDSRRLRAENKGITAQVLDHRTAYRSKGRTRYYLTVEFRTEQNQTIRREVQVDQGTQRAGTASKTTTVHYLPSNPDICQAGEAIELRWSNLAIGSVILVCGIIGIVFVKRPESREELADAVGEQLKRLTDTDMEYVPVDARQFKQADHAFYDRCQREFEQRGYVFVEDIEVVMKKPNKNFAPTFIRVLRNEDGTRIACIYYLKPALLLRTIGAKESRVCGIDTQFSDNTFVTTDNAEASAALEAPPAINTSHLPSSTSVEMLVQAHERRIDIHAKLHSAAAPMQLTTAEEIHRAMHLQNEIKADHRRQTGLTKAELERLGGVTDNKVINDLHADLSRQREESTRKAA